LKNNPQVSLADAAYTSHVGRREFAQRGMLVCADTADAAPALDRLDGQRVLTGTKFVNERSVAFMFPGQGSGYTSMGAELYRNESRFREIVDECSEILCSMVGYSLRDALYSSHATNGAIDLQGTENCELALFVMEYALAHLWMEWGVRPDCMIGQSIGEYVAACLAGVLSLPDSLFLLSTRSKLMYKASAGAMLAVLLPEREVAGLLGSELDLAAVNGASECVIAGPEVTIGELEAAINQRGQQCMRVPVRHALHSRMMDSISKELSAATLQLKLRPPQIPYISNVTGTWITPALATDHAYWGRQLRSTVRFADGISSLVKVADRILLEVGPGQTIRRLVLGHALRPPDQAVFGSMPSLNGETETEAMLNSLGKLWLQGKKIDWQGFWKHEKRSRVPLPTYAFDRKRYWIERQVGDAETPTVPAPAAGNTPYAAPQEKRESLVDDHATAYEAPTDDVEQRIAEIWQKLLGVERVGVYDSFFALGGHSMQGAQLLSMLRATFQVAIPLPTLFEVPTVAGMAERIRTLRPGTG
jgi:acyl transferase domain-containing protein